MDFLWIIALFLLGLAGVLFPEQLWKLEHFLTVKNGEPSEYYLAVSRMLGVFFMLAAIFCGLIFLVL